MTLTNCRATVGLNARATPISTNSSGTVQVGANNAILSFADADVAYSMRAIFAGSGDALALDLLTNDTTGSTSWVAGAAQVETATAAGSITGSGNASVVVTASGMTGSPKTISVAVLNSDTAATWAGKVRTALAADSAVSALFTVGGTTTAISLTRKPTDTFTVPGGTLNLYAANDATLNIALDNGTCTGITTAATSANTTAGVISDGVKIYDDATDFEGETIPAILSTKIYGFLAVNATGGASLDVAGSDDVFAVYPGTRVFMGGSQTTCDSDYTFTASGASDLTITVIGATA